ncbi:unnamed protein product [Medioppia subpectinata]|uniref:Uncharacterized protein n=1 Tax=Medioppia subpectinata TaxID=1979941 RepID=A0A7R9LIY5_9ACAR|nr:unnamed protein product [Medioppia subpectinata]CAG2119154.1 unnamed protein product [Medioppia subpectinata]
MFRYKIVGILHAIGCFGAIRLNENLLNLYLFLMIVLLFGDGILGIVWILRFNTIVAKLRGDLRLRLTNDYGMDIEFQVSN